MKMGNLFFFTLVISSFAGLNGSFAVSKSTATQGDTLVCDGRLVTASIYRQTRDSWEKDRVLADKNWKYDQVYNDGGRNSYYAELVMQKSSNGNGIDIQLFRQSRVYGAPSKVARDLAFEGSLSALSTMHEGAGDDVRFELEKESDTNLIDKAKLEKREGLYNFTVIFRDGSSFRAFKATLICPHAISLP